MKKLVGTTLVALAVVVAGCAQQTSTSKKPAVKPVAKSTTRHEGTASGKQKASDRATPPASSKSGNLGGGAVKTETEE